MLWVTTLASGLCVPWSSTSAVLKNTATSRQAAKPLPRTYGSCAVNTTWYSRLGSNPDFRQSCVGSGVAGNGVLASQRAQAQSPAAIVTSPRTPTASLSPPGEVRAAFVVSRLAGLYGTALGCTRSGWEAGPERLTMRPSTSPVMGVPPAPRATGTFSHCMPVSGAVG